jgi:hypothetical protein
MQPLGSLRGKLREVLKRRVVRGSVKPCATMVMKKMTPALALAPK